MIPSPADRDELFRAFSRGLFTRDLDALYAVTSPDFLWSYHDGLAVTKLMGDRAAIAAHLDAQRLLYATQRFHGVAYHHMPEITFMTASVSETVRATGEQREQRAIESYTFKDGRIATKDVYRKPVSSS